MKQKITAFVLSLLMCLSLVAPQHIFAESKLTDELVGNSEENIDSEVLNDMDSVDESETPEDLEETENSDNKDNEDEDSSLSTSTTPENTEESISNNNIEAFNVSNVVTTWSELSEAINRVEENAQKIIDINADITADTNTDKTILIKANQHIELKGQGNIKGLGFDSFKVEKGGSLTIDGPTITNSQIIVEGKLNLYSGKISDTKLEGPTIFVNGGEFTMSGGEFSGNEAVISESPQPSGLRFKVNYYQYAPITVYNGAFTLNAGSISKNKGYLRGGAIGVWGEQGSNKSKVTINGGEITQNLAIHNRFYAWGGGLYMEDCDFEMNGGLVAKNTAECGGGIVAIRSEAKILSGTISENTNGEYSGKGGGILITDTDTVIKNVSIYKNVANGPGGGLYIAASKDADHKLLIDGAIVKENSALSRDYYYNGGGLYIYNYKYTIDGGQFIGNVSGNSGGAISATAKSKGQINAGLFESNSSNGFWGGGAIYNHNDCELTINRALIKENSFKENFMIGIGVGGKNKPISRQGGGIWNCPAGHTIINITNGLAMYDNLAPNFAGGVHNGAGDDFANIIKYENDNPVGSSSVKLAPRMLGGGYRLWYQDGSFEGIHTNWQKEEQTPRYNPENPGKPLPYNTVIEEKKGAQLVYKSVPTQESKDLAEQVATTIFKNNFAQGVGISGGAITNNGKLIFGEDKPYKIQITKAWYGDDEKTRPEEIVLQMYVGDHYVQDVKLTKDGNWTATIEDFPDPDTLIDNKTGKLLPINFKEKDSGKYILSEVKKEKDTASSTYSIYLENSLKTEVKVNKVWDDNNDKLGKRPNSITVALLADGKETGKTIELNQDNDWKGEFKDLPSHKNGEFVKYTVKEVEVGNGYTSKITGNAKDGFTITNSRTPEKTTINIKVNKVWNDSNNQDGKRPETITVRLLKNGKEVAVKTLTQADNWQWEFANLEKYENGKLIEYTITEDKVPGYTSEIDGFTITNSRIPEKTNIKVNKVWDDNNNKDGKRPDSITVKLLADGKQVDGKVLQLSAKNNWSGEFVDLDVYKDGKTIDYTIEEVEVGNGYTSKITGNAKDGYTITNSRKPDIPKTGAGSSIIFSALLLGASVVMFYLDRKNKKHID